MPLKIVFMGTPDFAVPCLARIFNDGHEVLAVFSQPDRPQGRGHKLAPTAVKAQAQILGLPVYQPQSLKTGEDLEVLQKLSPDVMVVVAYGQILPQNILDIPRFGCINVHGSLLPKLRGAAPIQWSIINGDKLTGVTTMYMDKGLDTGDIILTEQTEIACDETAGELFTRLSAIGADCLSRTLGMIEGKTAPRTKQNSSEATHAPMLNKQIARIDFNMPAEQICNLVRGLNPWPMAFFKYGEDKIKVQVARPVPEFSGKVGEILHNKRLIIGCKDGAVELLKITPPAKKMMAGSDFVCGNRIKIGQMLTDD